MVVALLLLTGCRSTDSGEVFNGTALNEDTPAPGFVLRDQFNEPVELASYRDGLTVLTFLFTHCPNVCPIVTNQLRDIYRRLGEDAESVDVLVVSVDPERDTVEAAAGFLSSWDLLHDWRYLVGSRAELEPIWDAYYIDPTIDDPEVAKRVSASNEPRGAIDTLSTQISERYLVIHSTPVYLIDSEGRRRVVFTAPLEPDDVLEDIRALLD